MNQLTSCLTICREASMDTSEEAGEQPLKQHLTDPTSAQRAGELLWGPAADDLRGQREQGEDQSNQ